MNLTDDFSEFVQLLLKNKAEFLVVGGYAVAYHGYPRFTGDIDFWIKRDSDNAQRVVQSLFDFGFGSVDITAKDLIQEGNVIQLGFPPNRIDIHTSIDGLLFDECWNERKMIMIDDTEIPFISLYHLKINKKATGRKKDEIDLDNLP
ncbi:MAG: hypothetical protein ACK5Z2_18120 [Bacteroidota bacterium]|jgi:hypothetical protein